MAEEKKQFKRLPKSVKPTNYDLTLEPDLEKFSFKGSAVIDVQVRRIFVHSNPLSSPDKLASLCILLSIF